MERPNRFVVKCCLIPPAGPGKSKNGALVEAHLPDPGRLKELLVPGRIIWIVPANKPERKTRWSVVLCESPDGGGLVSLDSTLPNRLIAKALSEGVMDEFSGWRLLRREYRMGRSRWDFLLGSKESQPGPGRQMALEVKSVTLVENGVAMFPDAVTARGARHMRELSKLAQADGWASAVLFVVQREDALAFRSAIELDPSFDGALKDAVRAGVKVYCRKCRITRKEIILEGKLPVMNHRDGLV